MTWFAYSGEQVLAEYEDSGALDAFQPSRKFVYGAYVDEPLMMLSCRELAGGGRTETAYYYHQDRNFNVIALTDDTGQLAERYTYSAYGERATLQDAGLANPYFFTGRHFDAELTIYYYRARYHDPALGRFLSRDPLEYVDGMSLYEYVQGMPVQVLDPQGLKLVISIDKGWYSEKKLSAGGEVRYSVRVKILPCKCKDGKWVISGVDVQVRLTITMNPDNVKKSDRDGVYGHEKRHVNMMKRALNHFRKAIEKAFSDLEKRATSKEFASVDKCEKVRSRAQKAKKLQDETKKAFAVVKYIGESGGKVMPEKMARHFPGVSNPITNPENRGFHHAENKAEEDMGHPIDGKLYPSGEDPGEPQGKGLPVDSSDGWISSPIYTGG